MRGNPNQLDPDDAGVGDFYIAARSKANAKEGSKKLRDAILRAYCDAKPKFHQKRTYGRYGSWEERKAKFTEIRRVQEIVAKHFGLPKEAMTGWRGRREVSEKRQVAMYLAREVVQSSYPDIARCFGGKDHTTIIHGCRMVERNPDLLSEINTLREKLAA